MKVINRGTCEVCGEPIALEDPCYEMPYGELVHEECIDDYIARYHIMGEVYLGYDDET